MSERAKSSPALTEVRVILQGVPTAASEFIATATEQAAPGLSWVGECAIDVL